MLTAENYHLAWAIYAGCSLVLLVVFARIIHSLKYMPVKLWLLLTATCLLFVPVRADPEQVYLAPATLVFLLEVMFLEGEAGTRVLSLLVSSLVVVWMAALILWCGWLFLAKYRRKRDEEKLTENHAEQEREQLLEESFAATSE